MSVVIALGDEWFARLSDVAAAGSVPGNPGQVKVFLRGSDAAQILNFDNAERAADFRKALREAIGREVPA